MRTWTAVLALSLLLPGTSGGATTFDLNAFNAILTGFQEVPPISTAGKARLALRIGQDSLTYSLSFDGLEGGSPTAAHIHFGQRGVNGGVMAFLCGGGGKPACPPSGSVTGTIVAADVVGPSDQGIAPGEIGEAIRAISLGHAYANIHTPTYPGGEIRGHLVRGFWLTGLSTD